LPKTICCVEAVKRYVGVRRWYGVVIKERDSSTVCSTKLSLQNFHVHSLIVKGVYYYYYYYYYYYLFFEVNNALFVNHFSLIACDLLSRPEKTSLICAKFSKKLSVSACFFKILTLRHTSPNNVSQYQPVLRIYFLIDMSEILIVVVDYIKIDARKAIQEG
jgi:hypothetical protein